MRFKPLVLIALVLSTAVSLRAQQQIVLLANVVDPTTNAPPDAVDLADLRVSEDGVAAKALRVEAVNRVVKLQLLVDNGVGVGADNIGELRKGIRGLLEALPAGVETTVVTTAPQPRTVVRPTSDRVQLLKGVDLITPDSGAGRFVESLGEAAQRAQREPEDVFTVLISAATTSGDGNVQDRDVQRAFERVQSRPMVVHVLLFSGSAGRSATGGVVQTDVGLAVTKVTGGRYENINTMSRYVTLMPELGAEVAKQMTGQARQFRIFAERPNGKSGDFGRISLGIAGKIVENVTMEQQRKR